jgi:3'(2'), 5'-bisphosphate nucleotidase
MRRDAQLEVALDCVRAASSALLALRAHPRIEERDVLAQLGDNVSHSIITDALHRAFPDDVVLSEEGEPVGSAPRPRRLWVVDPLDGTKEYSSRGRDDWAVQVALVEGESPVLGVVALPAQGVVLHTSAAPRHVRRRARRLRIAVSRTRRPRSLTRSRPRSTPTSCRWARWVRRRPP